MKYRLILMNGWGVISLLEEYKDGVWFMDLSPITDSTLVAKEIIQVLKIQEEADKAIIDTLVENI
jgi:predicted ATPase